MKKNICIMLLMAVLASFSMMAQDKMIEVPASRIPHLAQQSLKAYYPGVEVARVIKHKSKIKNNYEVTLADSTWIEFDKDGNWITVVPYGDAAVPPTMVDGRVATYLQDRFPGLRVVKMRRDRKNEQNQYYMLENGQEVTFDCYFKPVEATPAP